MFLILILYFFLGTTNSIGNSPIHLKTRTIDPQNLERRNVYSSQDSGYYVIRTRGKDSHKKLLKALDITDFEHFIERDTFVVHIDFDRTSWNQLQDGVLFMDKLKNNDRSLLTWDFPKDDKSFFPVKLKISFFEYYQNSEIDEIRNIEGVNIVKTNPDEKNIIIEFHWNHAEILQHLKSLTHCKWIHMQREMAELNFGVNQIVQGGSYQNFNLHSIGLQGQNQIVGVCDSGLDKENCFFYDSGTEFLFNETMLTHRKIYFYQTFTDPPSYGDGSSGHGTHVTGTVLGKVYNNENSTVVDFANGVAPLAKVFFQDIGDSSGSLSGIPDNVDVDLFPLPYSHGVRIHSNSWGCSYDYYMYCHYDCDCYWARTIKLGPTTYNKDDNITNIQCNTIFGTAVGKCCQWCTYYDDREKAFDDFLFNNDEMVILVAAGNVGEDSSTTSLGAPATAKNIVTVGASQTTTENFANSSYWRDQMWALPQINSLCGTMFVKPNDACGYWSGDACGVTDHRIRLYLCDAYQAEAYRNESINFNENNMADFSSRGPSLDGNLIKPEIVAPGYTVVSAKAWGNESLQEPHCGLDVLDPTGALISKQGTSMATPAVAGFTALIRQYFEEGFYPSGSPVVDNQMTGFSGMLVKGILVHSALALTGNVQLGDGSFKYFSPADGLPNIYFGHGLIDLDSCLKTTLSPESYFLGVLDREVVSDGGFNEYRFKKMNNSNLPFIATMLWYEPGKDLLSAITMINNLDLRVNADGSDFWGNGIVNGDTENNCEKVIVDAVDVWTEGNLITVRVDGTSVVTSGLKYAIVVSGYNVDCEYDFYDRYSLCTNCIDGYTKEGIDCVPFCSIACVQNATCLFPDTCICDEGFLGEGTISCIHNCSLLNNCTSDNGQCIATNNCSCYDSWSELDCSVCNPMTIVHPMSGTCSPSTCADLWEGATCNTCTQIIHPDTGTCQNNVCLNDWYGANCSSCDIVHPNGSTCEQNNCSDLWTGGLCSTCTEIVHPQTGTCQSNTCSDSWFGATCNQCNIAHPQTGTCNSSSCANLWTGSLCDICSAISHPDTDTCQNNVCLNDWYGANCSSCDIVHPNGSTCEQNNCADLWTGGLCSTCTEIVHPQTGTCQSNTCSDSWFGATCNQCNFAHPQTGTCNSSSCANLWNGALCDICSAISHPDTDTCQNNVCLNDWYGETCNSCDMVHPNVTTCDQTNCADLWTGTLCDTCTTITNPDADTCQNNVCIGEWFGTVCDLCNIVHPIPGTCTYGVCENGYSGNVCNSCDVGYFAYNGSCYSDCTSLGSFYGDGSDNDCKPCAVGCAECSSNILCTQCLDISYLPENNCQPTEEDDDDNDDNDDNDKSRNNLVVVGAVLGPLVAIFALLIILIVVVAGLYIIYKIVKKKPTEDVVKIELKNQGLKEKEKSNSKEQNVDDSYEIETTGGKGSDDKPNPLKGGEDKNEKIEDVSKEMKSSDNHDNSANEKGEN